MKVNEATIKALEDRGFKVWEKAGYRRVYFNATHLGFTYSTYKTGNISDAYWQGERVSNAQGRRYLASKTYLDCYTGEVVSDYDELKEAAEALIAEATAEA